jgi:hypothetical protein
VIRYGPKRGLMSEKNGDKARFQKNRKRGVLRRMRVREMLAAGGAQATRPAPAKPKRSQS